MEQFTYDDLIEAYIRYAEKNEAIRAAIMIGSRARVNEPADRWSDLDLIMVTTRPEEFLDSSSWLDAIQPYLITFLEKTAIANAVERRVLFAPDLDVDFVILTPDDFKMVLSVQEAAEVFGRGYRTIIDKDGLASGLSDLEMLQVTSSLTPEQFDQTVQDFWYHCIWTMKKVLRGELWAGKVCLDCFLKRRLLTVVEWHAQSSNTDTWHDGRFVDKWGDPIHVLLKN